MIDINERLIAPLCFVTHDTHYFYITKLARTDEQFLLENFYLLACMQWETCLSWQGTLFKNYSGNYSCVESIESRTSLSYKVENKLVKELGA